MRGKSHRCLGRYLADTYMINTPKRYVRAFLLGCVEPDSNPATYLKGSIRSQWLRGHNYGNAQRYMWRIAQRLERKQRLSLLDYYTMGKLIHYTTDAFTFAHNAEFSAKLSEHREYEASLQDFFLQYLERNPHVWTSEQHSIMDMIQIFHRDYIRRDKNVKNDAKFALRACCCVLALLLTPKIL